MQTCGRVGHNGVKQWCTGVGGQNAGKGDWPHKIGIGDGQKIGACEGQCAGSWVRHSCTTTVG
jgi:hypothetical protein